MAHGFTLLLLAAWGAGTSVFDYREGRTRSAAYCAVTAGVLLVLGVLLILGVTR